MSMLHLGVAGYLEILKQNIERSDISVRACFRYILASLGK